MSEAHFAMLLQPVAIIWVTSLVTSGSSPKVALVV